MIDINKFVSSGTPITSEENWERYLTSMNLNFLSLRGNEPVPADTELYIPIWLDEMLFLKGSVTDLYETPPSVGETVSIANNQISSIELGNVRFENLEELNEFDISVPGTMTADEIEIGIIISAKYPEFGGSDTEQVKSGTTVTFTPPETIPGVGKITALAGNRVKEKVYNVNFRLREPLYLENAGITGIDINAKLTGGQKTISVPVNNGGEETAQACAIAVVANVQTGTVASLDYRYITIQPGTRNNLSVDIEVPSNAEDYKLNIYYLDSLTSLNIMYKAEIKG
jgi:hypothetical protein